MEKKKIKVFINKGLLCGLTFSLLPTFTACSVKVGNGSIESNDKINNPDEITFTMSEVADIDSHLEFVDTYSKVIPTENKDISSNKEENLSIDWDKLKEKIKSNTQNNGNYLTDSRYVKCSDEEIDEYLVITEKFINDLFIKYPELDKREVVNTLLKVSFCDDQKELNEDNNLLGTYFHLTKLIAIHKRDDDKDINYKQVLEHELVHAVEDTPDGHAYGVISYNKSDVEKVDLSLTTINEYCAEKVSSSYENLKMGSYSSYSTDIDFLGSIVKPNPDYKDNDTIINLCLTNNTADFIKMFGVENREDLSKLYKILYMMDVVNGCNRKNISLENDLEIDRTNINENLLSLLFDTYEYGLQILSKNMEKYGSNISDKDKSRIYDLYYCQCVIMTNKAKLKEQENVQMIDQLGALFSKYSSNIKSNSTSKEKIK